ncbi:GNAT family N-acetyltransferase [Microvirga sp. c23x22]|uniref:GNAT family N-acetyltransferase n=2 Tax=Microvirga terricola TaxID=2719797 RepID=A0ABX0VAD9_9HYPH|nr:GNAT family N-acetyltransferase [Microvirga terricola]
MREAPALSPATLPDGWSLQRLTGDRDRYRALFRRVGEPWLWFSRITISDEELAAILDDPKVEAYALHDGTADVGLLELDFRVAGEAELGFLGLVPGTIGKGAGRFLMNEAITRAFARPIGRFFVHTCNYDHPSALDFYRRSGFVPYKFAIEVDDDPRVTGALPREAAPQIPLFD